MVGCDGGRPTFWNDAVRKLFDEIRPDVVVPFGGPGDGGTDLPLVLPAFHSLLGSTLNVLVASTTSGCRRIVTTGSLTEPAEDDLEPIPSSPYAAAKWSATAYARMFHSLYQTPVVVLRPFMTYGPGQHETKIVPYVINSLIAGKIAVTVEWFVFGGLGLCRRCYRWVHCGGDSSRNRRLRYRPGFGKVDVDTRSCEFDRTTHRPASRTAVWRLAGSAAGTNARRDTNHAKHSRLERQHFLGRRPRGHGPMAPEPSWLRRSRVFSRS